MNDTIEKNGLENLPEGVTKEQLLDIVEQASGSRQEARAVEEIQIGNISAARVRLEKLKAQRKPIIEQFDYEGEAFYIKRLHSKGLVDLAMSLARDGHNVLNIQGEDGVVSSMIAVLESCICNKDATPFFDRDSLGEMLETPDDTPLITALFERALESNPDVFSTLKKS